MITTKLTLLDSCITIQGEYYVVSNGFISKAYGKNSLYYKDILAVEIITQRSKKAMYVMLFPTGIMVLLLSLEIFLLAIIALAVIICVTGLIYLFSARRFVEITSMRGTYRIAMDNGDLELENTVERLQRRMFPKA
ncbi:MAG: hypothetical protein FWG65_00070 [Turicibacter sp.]|nr:hypothetical protein [Turicibacter sp.]